MVTPAFGRSETVPVTPTLLLKLRKTLGDEAANDLVTWVDQATARELGQMRELADLHYGRFDARLEQRLAELRADVDARIESLRAELHTRIESLRTDIYTRIESLRTDLYTRIDAVRVEMMAQRADLIKWMFLFWVGTIVPLAGLMVALVRL
jgi:hypothetical protein